MNIIILGNGFDLANGLPTLMPIIATGSGYIEAELQIGSSSDLSRGEGAVSSMSFPLDFTLHLIIENATGKLEDEKYLLDDVNYKIDTSSYNN